MFAIKIKKKYSNGMNKLKEINLVDYIITTVITLPLALFIYNFLYKYCNYSNLKDLYVSEAIFNDHNKYLDLGIFFIYFALFICILFAIKIFRKNRKKEEVTTVEEINTNEKTNNAIIQVLKRFQHISLLGFLLLHPLDGSFYPLVLLLSIILILIGLWDIKKRKSETFSPFAITAFCFIFYYLVYPYTSQIDVTSPDHHLGEKFATYYMHEKFGLEYYKDIMLVHGFFDVIPSWFGDVFFKEITIYSSYLGMHLLNYLIFISTLTMALYLFNNSILFVVPLLLIKVDFVQLYIVTFILLTVGNLTKKPLLWLITYIIVNFLFIQNWTTIGSFCFIASIPFAVNMIIKLFKESNNKLRDISIILLVLLSIFYFSHDLILGYLKEAQYYVKGNLPAFGNSFPSKIQYLLLHFPIIIMKLFALLMVPCLFIELCKEFFNKNISKVNIYLLAFLVLFPIVSISYTLGRIDGKYFTRIFQISLAYIALVIPYLIYYKNVYVEKFYTVSKILFIIICCTVFLKITFGGYHYINDYVFENTSNIGKHEFDYPTREKIRKINNVVNKYVKDNEIFFDLSNCGMNYMYTSKKVPVMYVSYYNSISTGQAKNSLEKLMQNPPKLIMLGTINSENQIFFHYFDRVRHNLRINPIYRWLLLSEKYELVIENDCIFLLLTNKEIKYNNQELILLDTIFSMNNLMFLPEAWGNSVKTLPIEKQEMKFSTNELDNTLTITFEKPINGKSIQLILIEPKDDIRETLAYKMSINNNKDGFYFLSKRNGKLLIPFDSLPSFMLNEEIKEIVIISEKPIKTKRKITFYKRK